MTQQQQSQSQTQSQGQGQGQGQKQKQKQKQSQSQQQGQGQRQAQAQQQTQGYQAQPWEKIVVYLTGAGFIGLVMYLLVRNQPFADPNLVVMARALLSVFAGLFTATIPGFLNVDFSAKGFSIRAGGALAMAVLTFLLTPEVLPLVPLGGPQ